jgi:MFS family permease
MQQAFFIMRIIGPSSAAFLVAAFGAKSCYYLDALSFLISGSLIASLTLSAPKKSAAAGQPAQQKTGIASILHDMRQGASFILHHTAVLFVIVAMASGMFVMGCFGPLIAVYVRDNLHQSTRTFGVASAMIGVGLLVGVNVLNTVGKRIANTTQVYCGLGGIAIATLLMALLPHTAIAIFGCFLVGFAAAGIIVPAQTLIQQETPHELMGRVGSTNMSVIFGAQIAGLLLSGVLAEHTSVRRVFLLSTGMLAALMLAGKLWMEPQKHPPIASTAS